MKLTTFEKLCLIAVTLLPAAYLVLFMVTVPLMATSPATSALLSRHFGIFLSVHVAMMLVMFALLAFYITYLFKDPVLSNDVKVLWTVIIFFGGPVAMPVFWYLNIWKRQLRPSPC